MFKFRLEGDLSPGMLCRVVIYLYNNLAIRFETLEADSDGPVFIRLASYSFADGFKWLPVVISNEMQTPLLVRFRGGSYHTKFLMKIYTEYGVIPRSVDIVLALLSTEQSKASVFFEKFCTSPTTGKPSTTTLPITKYISH